MAQQIRSYDYRTASAIDKGQTVQELAVAVKELVENSMDADAKEIGKCCCAFCLP